MRQTFLKIIFVLALASGHTGLHAQESISTAGGHATGSGGSAGYTAGQVFFNTHSGPNGSAAQGVQQPYEISVVTEIKKASGITLLISANPNPTTDFLTLSIKAPATLSIQSLSYQLFDMNGKLLETSNINAYRAIVDMSRRVPATYLLRVAEGNKEIKTFRIIKTY